MFFFLQHKLEKEAVVWLQSKHLIFAVAQYWSDDENRSLLFVKISLKNGSKILKVLIALLCVCTVNIKPAG